MSTDDETLESKAAKWDEIRLAWETYDHAGFFDWDYDSRTLMRKLTGGYVDEPDLDMIVVWQSLPVVGALRAVPFTGTLPVYEEGQRVGACVSEAAPRGGYVVRWYKLPASAGIGADVPTDQMEFLFGALYGNDRQLIRKFDA